MEWLEGPGYWWSRWLLTRSLGAVYVIAFVATARQWVPLLGERGLLPVTDLLARVPARSAPSIFHWRYSDRSAVALAWLGAVVSGALAVGLPQQGPAWAPLVAWLAVWLLYLSFVNVGRVFYGFGWESILLEAGFLAAFLGADRHAPPLLTVFLLRWLLFRVEFGAGLIKLRGDPCWRDLTCLDYHHETQPMPNPLSWRFHHLPRPFHRAEVLGNHLAQLVAPWLLFAPQPVATVGAGAVVVTQAWLVLSGNFSWLNAVTVVLALSAVAVPAAAPEVAPLPAWLAALTVVVTVGIGVASWWPVRNMLSRNQRMNASFNPFHLVGTYGAFGSITRRREEVVVEGSRDGRAWQEYEFPGKPGDPRRRPPQVAPYHLRLDWMLWFVPLSPGAHLRWLLRLLEGLLSGEPDVRRLLRRDPFAGEPPREVRVRLFRYRFTSPAERRETGAWWHREEIGPLVGPLTLDDLRTAAPRGGRPAG